MEFVYDDIYIANFRGNCDTCGSPHRADNLHIKYKGMLPKGYYFYVLSPFSCPGCHKEVEEYFLLDPMDISKELESIKK